jgi:hypothetical protein
MYGFKNPGRTEQFRKRMIRCTAGYFEYFSTSILLPFIQGVVGMSIFFIPDSNQYIVILRLPDYNPQFISYLFLQLTLR